MPTFIVRVWLPDRPGALGAVASRIGAVRGDVVGIDILERGGGRAIDELAVELPDASLVSLLVNEIGEVDGVDVEDVRAVESSLPDPRLDALEAAARLMAADSSDALVEQLTAAAHGDFESDWCAAVLLDDRVLVASQGAPPPAAWLVAFVAGSHSSDAVAGGEAGPDDVACGLLTGAGLALVLGRQGRPFRTRERRQLAALARIADHRWMELQAPRPPSATARGGPLPAGDEGTRAQRLA